MLKTYQDFLAATDRAEFIMEAIGVYKTSETYRTAIVADKYDTQRNETINEIVPKIYNASGTQIVDKTASNNKIASNFFNRLNTQRLMYSLANGVSFIDPYEAAASKSDTTREALGADFDNKLADAAYHALIHGVSYMFWDVDKCYVFKATEFVPLVDETTGVMSAGVRFWQLDRTRPMNVVLYEKDGFTVYRMGKEKLEEVAQKRSYKVTYQYTDVDIEPTIISEENYVDLPIVRMYSSRKKQSTLIGMREAIDAYDIIKSGFANDMQDCAQVYWIVENYGGMTEEDLAQFLDRLKLNHIANADTQGGGKVTPYSQEIPYQARQALLEEIRNGIYEDFGALDVHAVAAGATNDHIDAAYQPMDENAADFEHCISDAIVKLLALQGIEDKPVFTRNRISNQKEQVEMLVQEAQWLDHGTILRKLPNITSDEANAVMQAVETEDAARFGIASTGDGEPAPEIQAAR